MRAFDHSFAPKIGKKTPGRDWFYNGCAGRSEKGLELSLVAVVNLDQNTACALHAKQILPVPQWAELRLTPVRFGWGQISFGDIRDLNRHRTGTKVCLLMPWGFYGATDQTDDADYHRLAERGAQLAGKCMEALRAGQASFVYGMNLGAQFDFEHTTTADKFICEAEMRVGVGTHYRYAGHLHEVLALWYEKFPLTRGVILEGSANQSRIK